METRSRKRKESDSKENRKGDLQDKTSTTRANQRTLTRWTSASPTAVVKKRTKPSNRNLRVYIDPFTLPEPSLLDKILECLDFKSILRSRLETSSSALERKNTTERVNSFSSVCRLWNEQIIGRNILWKPQCLKQPLQLNGFQPVKGIFYDLFIVSQRILRPTCRRQEEVLEVVEHPISSDLIDNAQQYILGSYFPNFSRRSPVSARREGQDDRLALDDWLAENIWLDCRKCRFDMYDMDRVVIVTRDGVLKIVNSKDRQVLWEREKCQTFCVFASNDLIFTAPFEGAINVFSLDGSFEHQLEPNSKLEDIVCMDVHPSGRFLLTGLYYGEVRLVNDKKEVFEVDITITKREERDGFLRTLCFLSLVVLTEDLLAISVYDISWLRIAVINQTGRVQSELVFQRSRMLMHTVSNSAYLNIGEYIKSDYRCLKIEKRRIVWEPSCFKVRPVWVTNLESMLILPEPFGQEYEMNILASGRKFFLLVVNRDLFILRQDCGTVFAKFPGFFESMCLKRGWGKLPRMPQLPYIALEMRDYPDGIQTGLVIVNNGKWLNGLCPSTTDPGEPILVFLNKYTMTRKCIYWSSRLWSDLGREVIWNEDGQQDPPQPSSSGIWNSADLFKQSLVQ